MSQTILPFYCGVYSHSVWAPRWMEIEEPVTISKEECNRLHEYKIWTDPRGNSHQLLANHTNRVYYNEVGWTSNDGSVIECKGDKYYQDGKSYDYMVVSVNRVIEIYDQAAKVDENKAINGNSSM